ncbi:MAG: hypothetical protein HY960_04575 [Ignavibacteriae bacterium]|nr:hypothetical protein [Ignavibacteriota bacterium]
MAIEESPVIINRFLESYPPGTESKVRVYVTSYKTSMSSGLEMPLGDLQLYCSSEQCNGIRSFRSETKSLYPKVKESEITFLQYSCRNCLTNKKIFAVIFTLHDNTSATIYKMGEVPVFGDPTPTRLLSLLGSEKDYFLKGRRAENQSLGIGAFAYYRRVVENQKNRILDEVIKVADLTNAPTSLKEALKQAREEPQFSRAVESLKGAIPDSLLIEGHNPLTLLHQALSEGIHAQTDEECLDLAGTIRTVLSSFAERVGEIRREQSQLKEAISKLLNRKKK